MIHVSDAGLVQQQRDVMKNQDMMILSIEQGVSRIHDKVRTSGYLPVCVVYSNLRPEPSITICFYHSPTDVSLTYVLTFTLVIHPLLVFMDIDNHFL